MESDTFIDWTQAPSWANYVTIDRDGEFFFHENKPEFDSETGCWSKGHWGIDEFGDDEWIVEGREQHVNLNINPQLQERPEELKIEYAEAPIDYDMAIRSFEQFVAQGHIILQNWNHYHEWERDEREKQDIQTYENDAYKKDGIYYLGDGIYNPKDKNFVCDAFELLEFYVAHDNKHYR